MAFSNLINLVNVLLLQNFKNVMKRTFNTHKTAEIGLKKVRTSKRIKSN